MANIVRLLKGSRQMAKSRALKTDRNHQASYSFLILMTLHYIYCFVSWMFCINPSIIFICSNTNLCLISSQTPRWTKFDISVSLAIIVNNLGQFGFKILQLVFHSLFALVWVFETEILWQLNTKYEFKDFRCLYFRIFSSELLRDH